MPKIIKDKQLVDNQWLWLSAEGIEASEVEVSDGATIVPLSVWVEQKSTLSQRSDIAVHLSSDDDVELLKDDAKTLPLIAFYFPVFMDGRGFSAAFRLRDEFGFTGELRACGHFIRDQLRYLERCGFNAFAPEEEDVEVALESLNDLQEVYQASADQAPLFRRR